MAEHGQLADGRDAQDDDFEVDEQGRRLWYSTWQLLGLERASRALGLLDRVSTEQRDLLLEYEAEDRELYVELHVLSPRALPEIRGILNHSGDALERRLLTRDAPPDVLAMLGSADLTSLQETGHHLLMQGGGLDPVRNLFPLLRHLRSSEWERVTGEARRALWLRYAGEVLLDAYEDASRAGLCDPLPTEPSKWGTDLPNLRLRRAPEDDLAQHTLRYHLSDQPRVLLAVEGETEFVHVARLLKQAGIPTHYVDVVSMGSVDKMQGPLVGWLLRVVASETSDAGDIHLGRALTHVIVATDPEGSWRPTKAARSLKALRAAVSDAAKVRGVHTDDYPDVLDMVEHFPWSPRLNEVYELASFTDEELAEALIAVYGTTSDAYPVPADLRAAVGREVKRLRDIVNMNSEAHHPKLVTLTKAVWGQGERKVDLAEALVPTILDPSRDSPARRLVQRAWEVLPDNPRGRVGLQKKAPTAPALP